MNTIRALIVDDEKPARERLRRLLLRDTRIQVARCCAGGKEALEFVRNEAADGRDVHLIFLDVQMPEFDGFAVASSLLRDAELHDAPAELHVAPVIVFVTAHDEYALRAFECHAIDYLLKPFSDERFQAAVDRAIRHVRAGRAEMVVSQMKALLGSRSMHPPIQGGAQGVAGISPHLKPAADKILVRGPHRVRLLPVEQISWIEADGMYVKFHTRDGGVHLHRGLLGSLDASLDEHRFVRIHRSTVVNMDVVDELRQDAHGDYVAVLRDRTEVRVGRRFRTRLEARLGQVL